MRVPKMVIIRECNAFRHISENIDYYGCFLAARVPFAKIKR